MRRPRASARPPPTVDALRQEDDPIFGGFTPLMRLCFHGRRHDEQPLIACAELLLAAGANVDAADGDGDTSLSFAAGLGSPRLIKRLLDAGADPNAAGADGWAPLHWASEEGGIEGAALLIKHGAAVNAKTACESTGRNETSLEIAFRNNRLRMYRILLSAGASLPTICHGTGDDEYIERVVDAAGFVNYERRHLDRLTAMLTPTPLPTDGRRRSRRRLSPLRRLPPEVLRRIVAFAFHVGYY